MSRDIQTKLNDTRLIKKFSDLYLREFPDAPSASEVSELRSLLPGSTQSIDPEIIFPGQKLLIGGCVAISATKLMLKYHYKELSRHFSKSFLETLSKQLKKASQDEIPDSICSIDISEKGVYGALFRLSEETGLGFEVNPRKIPVFQETVELCEFWGLNPYLTFSAGARLYIVNGNFTLPRESCAAVIGSLQRSKDKVLCYDEEFSLLNRPVRDEYLKIIKIPETT